jgi:hypothetical protein
MFGMTTSSPARKNVSRQAESHSIPQQSDFVRTGMLRRTRSATLNADAEFEKGHSIWSELLKSESDALGQPPFLCKIAQKVSAVLNKLSQNDIQSDVPLDSKKLCLTL